MAFGQRVKRLDLGIYTENGHAHSWTPAGDTAGTTWSVTINAGGGTATIYFDGVQKASARSPIRAGR